MAATNCDSILRKCSFTMHIRFCMRSLIRPNAKPSRLNLAWIDSSLCYGGPGGREQTLHTCGFCALHVGRFCGYTLTTNTGFGFKQITKGDLRVRTLNNSRHTLQNKRRFACPDITSILTLNKSRHTLQNKTRFLPKTLPVSRSKTLHVSRSKTLHFSRLIIF